MPAHTESQRVRESERKTERQRDREKCALALAPNVVVGDGKFLGALYENAILLPRVECFRHRHAARSIHSSKTDESARARKRERERETCQAHLAVAS